MKTSGLRLAFFGALAAALSGCPQSGVFLTGNTSLTEGPASGAPGPGSSAISVSWDANREHGVNSAGGGYRVYYSTGAVTATSPFVNVPYASGAAAPTTARISGVATGTYSVSVVAYSAANPTGSAGAQTTVIAH